MSAPRRWSGTARPLPTDLILELRQQGCKDWQIAALLGCHKQSLYPHLKPLTDAKRARHQEAREWIAAGASFGMLARLYGVSKGNIRAWVRGYKKASVEPVPLRRRCECGGLLEAGVRHHCWATGQVA